MRPGATLFALLMAAAACGGGSAPSSSSASALLDDFTISPSVLEVDAGAEVTIDVSNVGGIEHSLLVLVAGAEAGSSADLTGDVVLAATATLGPGGSESLVLTAPQAGEYQVVCGVPGHLEAGMTARLRVGG